jgi:GTP cyclohydrolase I
MKTTVLGWEQVEALAKEQSYRLEPNEEHALYGIPRGGVYVASMICQHAAHRGLRVRMVEHPEEATVFVDDLVDSGRTLSKYCNDYQVDRALVLVDKRYVASEVGWVSFPWERMSNETGPEDAIVRILEYIGEDPERDGLRDTPKRVIKSYQELFSGYQKTPESVITTFEDTYDEMVVVKDVEFYSFCEHHMLPFFGKAHIAYLPDRRVLGVSKLVRILEIYSRRLQIQERLCRQITDALDTCLTPKGSACVLEAQHFCMVCRGVEKQNSRMLTSSLTGAFRERPEVRSEFMSMIGK